MFIVRKNRLVGSTTMVVNAHIIVIELNCVAYASVTTYVFVVEVIATVVTLGNGTQQASISLFCCFVLRFGNGDGFKWVQCLVYCTSVLDVYCMDVSHNSLLTGMMWSDELLQKPHSTSASVLLTYGIHWLVRE